MKKVGLHYCVVLDKKNVKSHSTLTVVPLNSKKDYKKICNSDVYLGTNIFENTLKKARSVLKSINKELTYNIEEKMGEYYKGNTLIKIDEQEAKQYHIEMQKIRNVEKIIKELEKMKIGTVALVNQITTISKQRIYDPKNDSDILAGIKLSQENMKLIDEKIKKFFIDN